MLNGDTKGKHCSLNQLKLRDSLKTESSVDKHKQLDGVQHQVFEQMWIKHWTLTFKAARIEMVKDGELRQISWNQSYM